MYDYKKYPELCAVKAYADCEGINDVAAAKVRFYEATAGTRVAFRRLAELRHQEEIALEMIADNAEEEPVRPTATPFVAMIYTVPGDEGSAYTVLRPNGDTALIAGSTYQVLAGLLDHALYTPPSR